MENLIARYFKRADIQLNRIVLPKQVIDKFGREFYMDVYEDGRIVLTPINKKEN